MSETTAILLETIKNVGENCMHAVHDIIKNHGVCGACDLDHPTELEKNQKLAHSLWENFKILFDRMTYKNSEDCCCTEFWTSQIRNCIQMLADMYDGCHIKIIKNVEQMVVLRRNIMSLASYYRTKVDIETSAKGISHPVEYYTIMLETLPSAETVLQHPEIIPAYFPLKLDSEIKCEHLCPKLPASKIDEEIGANVDIGGLYYSTQDKFESLYEILHRPELYKPEDENVKEVITNLENVLKTLPIWFKSFAVDCYNMWHALFYTRKILLLLMKEKNKLGKLCGESEGVLKIMDAEVF